MKHVALVSDIHGNLEALDAVFAQVRTEKVYCLGDVVGYGANPNEVIQLLKSRNVNTILGNHDYAVLTGDVGYFNPAAAIAVNWTARALTRDSAEYLRSLPNELRIEVGGSRVYLTHGSPSDNLWEYVDPATHSDLLDFYLRKLKVSLIGLGHTHVPYVWKGDAGTVVNPGSVGQPRSGDNRASFALVDSENERLDVRIGNVAYDIEKAARKIEAAGLPKFLAERLRIGR